MTTKEVLLVAAGGALGCIARHWVNVQFQTRFAAALIPWNTLVVNVLGCLLIGIVMQAAHAQLISASVRLFLVTGLLGGLTTFSTFGFEAWQCWELQGPRVAFLHLSVHLLLGLGAAMLGHVAGRFAFGSPN